MERPDRVILVAIWHFLLGALMMPSTCLMAALPVPLLVREAPYDSEAAIGLIYVESATVAAAIGGILALVTGFGLLQFQRWARWRWLWRLSR